MRYQDARKLHNGDRVILKKEHNDAADVLDVWPEEGVNGRKLIAIEAFGDHSGYMVWYHTEVK